MKNKADLNTQNNILLNKHVSISATAPLYSRVNFESFDVNYIRLERGVKPEHNHSSLQVSISLARSPLVVMGRQANGVPIKKLMRQGEACIFAPWQPHTIVWDNLPEWVSFHFKPQFLERAAHAFKIKKTIAIKPSFGVRDKNIFYLAYVLSGTMRDGEEPLKLHVQSIANDLIKHLFLNHAQENKIVCQASGGLTPAAVRRAIEFVDAHLSENLTIETLAASVKLSSFHFARAFKQSTGLAPHQFIVWRRMEKAKLLLTNRNLSVSEISRLVGYQNHSRFSNLFQKHTKSTPRKFREHFK